MPLDYLPLFAEKAAGKPTRTLIRPSQNGWHRVVPDLQTAKIALLTSAAFRTPDQRPFVPPEDTSYRTIPGDPHSTDLIMDHTSPLGSTPRQDPEVVFPRSALLRLAARGVVGDCASSHFSFVGGTRNHSGVERELAPALGSELHQQQVNLALLVPF